MYWLIFTLTVLAFGLTLYARHRMLKQEREPRPGYITEHLEPTGAVGGLAKAMRALGESAVVATWGSGSVKEWERRCNASLERSRRRRHRGEQ
jgi:hypothetical protein